MNRDPVLPLTIIEAHAFLDLALDLAHHAQQAGDVPVGAIVVANGKVIGKGYNQKECRQQPTAHAEIMAIQDAANHLGSWRLGGCILVSTLEPCPMCAGAVLQARLDAVVYGALDRRWGALGTRLDLIAVGFNHIPRVHYVPYPPCEQILTHFFAQRRLQKKGESRINQFPAVTPVESPLG